MGTHEHYSRVRVLPTRHFLMGTRGPRVLVEALARTMLLCMPGGRGGHRATRAAGIQTISRNLTPRSLARPVIHGTNRRVAALPHASRQANIFQSERASRLHQAFFGEPAAAGELISADERTGHGRPRPRSLMFSTIWHTQVHVTPKPSRISAGLSRHIASIYECDDVPSRFASGDGRRDDGE